MVGIKLKTKKNTPYQYIPYISYPKNVIAQRIPQYIVGILQKLEKTSGIFQTAINI